MRASRRHTSASVGSFIAEVCQRNKSESLQPASLLQPLQLPSQVWADLSMDFIDETITSDCDAIFTSKFWGELFNLHGSKLAFSSAYHPQTDGQTEVVNRTLAMYLRCFLGDTPQQWVRWLAWAEYCYNTSYHTALGTTPFQVVYGREPPRLLSYEPGSSRIAALDQALADRDVMQCIGTVAYRLKLPHDAKLHDVFHVSLLKPFKGDSPLLHTPLPPLKVGRFMPTPAQIRQARRVNNAWEVLVWWTDKELREASWETLESFQTLFPTFKLEDKLFLQEGGDVMDSIASRVANRRREEME
ncbi:uncharacterized protein [Aristolochia californica]|uniref:uncharacterized protein n=1 Tax=Aristolochia californica TaxID=171875 RepID=UPI0035D6362D